jgi:hypothetical protein
LRLSGRPAPAKVRGHPVARENKIEYLIDDGLLIKGGRIIAGTSAKRAASKIDSIRQAIFADETRAQTMRRTLADQKPPRLMILGTSDAMLEKICTNLWLNKPETVIRIEDVSSEEERRLARQTRISEGKHTIPVPSMEIKQSFPVPLPTPFPDCAAAGIATAAFSLFRTMPSGPLSGRPFPLWAIIPFPMKRAHDDRTDPAPGSRRGLRGRL